MTARRIKLSEVKPDAPQTAWTKRTKEALADVLKALGEGCTYRAAAAAAGISEDTITRWCHDDAEVAAAVIRAENECEARMTAYLTGAAPTDWRASESWLKRRRKQDYGDATTMMLKGYTDEQLDAIINDDTTRGKDRARGANPQTAELGTPKVTIVVQYADDPVT